MIKFQHAGEIGFYAPGIGKQFNDLYRLEYYHGYVPKEKGGQEIETFALKNHFNMYKFELFENQLNYYMGVGIYHVTGLKYQTSRRGSYPQQYYRLGSIRGLFFHGLEISPIKYKQHFAYFEASLNDIVITNYYNNPDVINPIDYISLAIGYGYKFE